MNSIVALAGLILALNLFAAPAAAQNWVITKTSWSASDEKNYSNFIAVIGESGCRTVDECIKSPANPYRGTDSSSLNWWSDCGRFPFLLRSYFASKNGLPMSSVSGMKAVDGLGDDLRYSPRGNIVTARKDITQSSAQSPLNGYKNIYAIVNSVFTAVYRYNAELDKPTGLFYDFVPARIDRNEIRPGTVIYDANGHAAIVYKVEKDGRVRFFDAHPDNSVTRSVYGEKFARSSPNAGAGFKNFRPLYLVGATQDRSTGAYIGGRITTVAMSQLPGFSMEQYYGTHPSPDKNYRKAQFVQNGAALPYYEFVRARLAEGHLVYKPVEEMLNMMDTLCSDIKDRVASVESSFNKGIHRKAQPSRLPSNIYGTSGEWEAESTPSRDARLKTSFVEIRNEVTKMVELQRQASSRIDYKGTNLVADLRDAYEKFASTCVIEYKRSDNSRVRLSYHDVVARLFALSFDPYHCPELRWGAAETHELVTCQDDSVKRNWYEAEQRLRNQIDRAYDVKMGFSLDELQRKVPGSGVETPPNVDLRGYLWSM